MIPRSPLALIFFCSLLLLVGCSFGEPAPQEEVSPPMTPEAQAARVSATLLSRKVVELREEALYLRHREEGRLLLQEFEEKETE